MERGTGYPVPYSIRPTSWSDEATKTHNKDKTLKDALDLRSIFGYPHCCG
jgi:hypothetical protein